MHLSHIPQYTIQNRNAHISVLNAVLWDMEYALCGICEIGLLISFQLHDNGVRPRFFFMSGACVAISPVAIVLTM